MVAIPEKLLFEFCTSSLEVLNAIKAMREQNLPKAEIYALLQQKGFPVTVEEAVDDVQRAIGKLDVRQNLLDGGDESRRKCSGTGGEPGGSHGRAG